MWKIGVLYGNIFMTASGGIRVFRGGESEDIIIIAQDSQLITANQFIAD